MAVNESTNSPSIVAVSEVGTGRAFVLIREQSAYELLSSDVAQRMSAKSKVLVLACAPITAENWQILSAELLTVLRAKNIRQASFVAFGAAGALVQNLCLTELKLVRTLALVDATSRAHPTIYSRLIDAAEKFLPLGLPFRHRDPGFDSKPYVQRIRCPVLLATTDQAGDFIQQEAVRLEKRLPTSWHLKTSGPSQAEELAHAIIQFQDVPARCPQKNLARGNEAQSA